MKKYVKEIYYKLPYSIKNVAASIVGYNNCRKRYGKIYKDYLEYFRKNDNNESYYTSYQLSMLKDILLECMKYSDYYKELFYVNNISKEFIEKANDINEILERIPFLEKQVLKENMKTIINKNPNRKTIAITHTSGTTGTPMSVEHDKDSYQKTFAIWRRFHDSIGLPENFKSIRLSANKVVADDTSKPPFWVYNLANNQLLMSLYHMSETNLSYYVNKINEFKPDLIDGFPSAVYFIANHIEKNNLKIKFKPIAICVTSETIYDYQREVIERVFNCKVYNQYSSSEGSPWIQECKCGNMHMNPFSGIFEFFNNGKVANPGDTAEMVVTSFRQIKTPLIRYRIGDSVLLPKENETCSCGSKMPFVKNVVGRIDDVFYTRKRGFIPAGIEGCIKGLDGINKAKFIQERINLIEVILEINSKYDKDYEKNIIKDIKITTGDDVNVKISYTDSMELSKSGKFKMHERHFDIESVI